MQQNILFIVWSYHVALMRCVSGKSDMYIWDMQHKKIMNLWQSCFPNGYVTNVQYNYHRANKKLLVKHEFVGNANMTTDTFMCVLLLVVKRDRENILSCNLIQK